MKQDPEQSNYLIIARNSSIANTSMWGNGVMKVYLLCKKNKNIYRFGIHKNYLYLCTQKYYIQGL